MEYPYGKLPTFGEFISRTTSSEFGCKFDTGDSPMIVDGDENNCVSIHYLQRTLSPVSQTYAMHIVDFDATMTFSQFRSICDRLEIPLAAFGIEGEDDSANTGKAEGVPSVSGSPSESS